MISISVFDAFQREVAFFENSPASKLRWLQGDALLFENSKAEDYTEGLKSLTGTVIPSGHKGYWIQAHNIDNEYHDVFDEVLNSRYATIGVGNTFEEALQMFGENCKKKSMMLDDLSVELHKHKHDLFEVFYRIDTARLAKGLIERDRRAGTCNPTAG